MACSSIIHTSTLLYRQTETAAGDVRTMRAESPLRARLSRHVPGGSREGIYCYQMTRRTLAKLAAGSGVLFQARSQQSAAAKYPGALDGYENKVDITNFDPIAWGRKLHESAPLRLTFKAQ